MRIITLLFIVILSAATRVEAENTTLQDVKVGFFNMPGYHEISPEGERSGYGYDFLQLMRRHTNMKFSYEGYDKDWVQMLQMLQDGRIDMLTGSFYTPERAKTFDYSIPMGYTSVNLVVRHSETRYMPKNYSTYNNMRIGCLEGDVDLKIMLDEYTAKHHFKATVCFFHSYEAMFKALQDRKIDAFLIIGTQQTGQFQVLDSFGNTDLFVIVKKGRKELLDKINAGIRKLDQSNANWKRQLYLRNYDLAHSGSVEFTEEEKEFIRQHSTQGNAIRVAVDTDWKPYSWYQDGQFRGILVELVQQAMKKAGIKYEFVRGNIITSDAIMKDETVDLYATFGGTPQRAEQLGLIVTPVYFTASVALLSNTNISQAKIYGLSQTTPILNVLYQKEHKHDYRMYPDQETLIKAVKSGDVDACVTYTFVAYDFINQANDSRMRITALPSISTPVCIAAKQAGEGVLIGIMTKCIVQMREDDVNSISAKYISVDIENVGVLTYLMQNPWIIFLALLLMLSIAFLERYRNLLIIHRRDARARRQAEKAHALASAQLQEIQSLNNELKEHQTQLEQITTEQKSQIEEIQRLNELFKETQDHAIRNLLDIVIKKGGDAALIDQLVQTVGEYYQADRAYVFETDETAQFTVNTYEWCAQGIKPEKDNLQQVPINVILPWIIEFGAKGCFYIDCNDEYAQKEPLVYEVLQPQGVTSLMAAPMVVDGDIIGFIGVDNPRDNIEHELYLSVAATTINHERYILIDKEEDQAHKREIEQAREAAEAASKAKTAFLFNMSHDIRTPMNAILGFANLMEKERNNPEVVLDYLGKIKSSGNFLLSLINNVLDMARIESGKMELDEEFFDLLDIKNNNVEIFMDMAQRKHITLTHTNHIEHRYVVLDEMKVRQIMLNLISNAIKYTPDGGKVNYTFEEVPCEREGYATYVATVSDTGIGMTPEYAKTIFDMFSRERNTTESKQEGTGLGMSIVKRLVELMGGTIEVKTELGKGTTFIVTLSHPIVDNPDQYLKQQMNNDEMGSAITIQGKRILLAEDNELNAEIAITVLEESGLLVERAEDGVQCVKMLSEAEQGYYDAILMDVQMPTMNGYEATRTIRKMPDPTKANIPIIAMTANAFDEDKKIALDAGMNGHLAKPVDVAELMNTLAKMIH